ncbi:hypothetical protein CLFO_13440 [Clostridium formicaceticum]|uniref:TIGR02679 family protein n=1 Tax=Clostridium formicaceticum TaxID=1497 RepID=A0AAC9RMF0_9CLOT|nr:hypothetical protein CLFO_13440 [Clostridium formicaceticum]
MLDTKFEDLKLIDILEAYFQEKLISKKEEKNLYEWEKEAFFHQILKENQGTAFGSWLQKALETKEFGYRSLSLDYDADREALEKNLLLTAKAVKSLPYYENHKERLAFFSSRISKNPHTFDEGSPCHKLLLYHLMFLFQKNYPQNAEERAEIYYQAGIIKDDISNYTTCFGLLAYDKQQIHTGWEGFYKRKEPMQVSLWNLSEVERITSPFKKVFVVENPTVFSGIIDAIQNLKVSLVCTNGQVKLASLILLDKLVEEGFHIYYSGDFDPEGLMIADKLKRRYKENLTLWRYTKEDYKRALSHEGIAKSRMEKTNKLQDATLIDISLEMQKLKVAGYQELLMTCFKEDVMRLSV